MNRPYKKRDPTHGWGKPKKKEIEIDDGEPYQERRERQELHCHECGRYVQFTVDLGVSGNRVIICPQCGHEHCRVVRNGFITDQRWDTRNRDNGMWISSGNTTTVTSFSNYATASASTASGWLADSWAQTGYSTATTTQ